MNLENMHPEKHRRMMRYTRERKNFRLTSFAIYKIKLMSDHYNTTETAIVEAAIHLLSDAYIQDQIDTVGAKAPKSEAIIKEGFQNQTIADKLGV